MSTRSVTVQEILANHAGFTEVGTERVVLEFSPDDIQLTAVK